MKSKKVYVLKTVSFLQEGAKDKDYHLSVILFL